jgi:hypothetical protein
MSSPRAWPRTRPRSRARTAPLGAVPGRGGGGPAWATEAADAYFIRPEAQGANTGLTVDDATTYDHLAAIAAVANSGAVVDIISDDGTHQVNAHPDPIVRATPLTIRGRKLDGTAGVATINSTRADYVDGTDYPRSDARDGRDGIRLADGVTDVTIDSLNFTNVGFGIIGLGSTTRLTITNITASNALAVLNFERDADAGTILADTYTHTGMVVQNVTAAGYELGCFLSAGHHIHDDAMEDGLAISAITKANPGVLTVAGHPFATGQLIAFSSIAGMVEINGQSAYVTKVDDDHISLLDPVTGETIDTSSYTTYTSGGLATRQAALLIEDVTGDAERQRGQAFCDGFHMSGTSASAVINRVQMDNSAYYTTAGVYWNSDGIGDEPLTDRAVYTDCGASGNDDGGVDLKGTNVVLNSLTVSGNKKNVKVWGSGVLNDLSSTDPVKNGGTDVADHVLIAGSVDTTWTFNNPTFVGNTGNSAPVFRNEKSGGVLTLNINDYTVTVQPGTTGISDSQGTAVVTWDPALPTITGITPTWGSGFEGGTVDEATSAATDMATLAISGTASSPSFTVTADADGKFSISGTTLKLAATLNAGTKTMHFCTIQAYDETGLVGGSYPVTIYVNATTLDTDMQAFETALTGASITTPTTAGRRWRAAYDNLFRNLKALLGSDYAKFDGFYVTRSYALAAAKRNLKQNQYHATWNGSPTWSAKNPWTGNAVDAQIVAGFDPSTAVSPQFVRDSNHLFMLKSGVNQVEAVLDWGIDYATTRMRMIARLTGDVFSTGDMSSSTDTTANANSNAWCGVNRIISTSYKAFLNLASAVRSRASLAIGSGALVAGHGANTGGTVWTAGAYEWLSWGGGFPTEQTAFLAVQTAYAQFKAQVALAE